MCCKVKEMTAKIEEGAIFGISTCNNKKCTKSLEPLVTDPGQLKTQGKMWQP